MAHTNRLKDPVWAARLRRFWLPVLLVALFVVLFANAGINQLVSPIAVLALPVGVGVAIAVVASSLLFGLTHLVNVNATLWGPSSLTGGTFGPEASLMALLVCVVPTVLLLRRAVRTGRIRRRPRRVEA